MKTPLLLILAVLGTQLSIAQNFDSKIDMISSNWTVNDKTTFEKFDNRNTVVLNGGRITVKNLKFTNGTIEVDVYANSKRSFARITLESKMTI